MTGSMAAVLYRRAVFKFCSSSVLFQDLAPTGRLIPSLRSRRITHVTWISKDSLSGVYWLFHLGRTRTDGLICSAINIGTAALSLSSMRSRMFGWSFSTLWFEGITGYARFGRSHLKTLEMLIMWQDYMYFLGCRSFSEASVVCLTIS